MDLLPEKEPDHVFEDRSGIRGKVVIVALCLIVVLGGIWLWDLGRRMLDDVTLPAMAVPTDRATTQRPLDAMITLQSNSANPCAPVGDPGEVRPRYLLGYLPAADATALTGMRSRCGYLDRVLADAFLLGAPDGTVVPLWANRNLALQDLADSVDLPGGAALPVALITASTRTSDLEALLTPGPALDKLLADMTSLLKPRARPDLCLDLRKHPGLDPTLLRQALSRLKAASVTTAGHPLALCLISGPEAGFWRDAGTVALLDMAIVTGFRDASSPLVAPAAMDWFETAMADIRAVIPKRKLVVALGNFATVWQSGRGQADRISYAEAMTRADLAGLKPVFDPVSGASLLRYLDRDRQVNDLWLMDAAALHNQLAALDWDTSVAIWPLGYEDPAIWSLLQPGPQDLPATLRLQGEVDLSLHVLTEAGGTAIAAIAPARAGQRWTRLDPTGRRIVEQGYVTLPLPHRVTRHGGDLPGSLMLAFDGLPDGPEVAPLLATLADHGVKAAFFADLATLLRHEDEAIQIRSAGHVLGLRLLPALPDRPESLLAGRMQMNFEQLYLTRLFGAPARLVLIRPGAGSPHYSGDAFAAEADLLRRGLVSLRSAFDAPLGPIEPDDFADRILREGQPEVTQVLTLDLRQSAASLVDRLPALLARLERDGFQILPPALATGITDQPLVEADLPRAGIADALAFRLADFFLNSVTVLFFVMLVISATFSLVYIALSLIRRPRGAVDPDFLPPVSVIIPAFNEEKVIAACLESILKSDYPNFQVFVVDDGSTDHTSDVIRAMLPDHPQVHLLHEENAGKWHAANLALMEIDTPIFIAADADSIFLPDTIRWLVQPFRDEGVGAVAGLVEVGNRVNILTDFQHQEYMVTQNVLRRAHEFFDGILVVPGAVGAWRTQAVRQGGGFSGETITEDADLTVAVHRAGYRVEFEERARSITEAPVTVRAFMRQRLRWQLGMLQVSWKHRGVITSGMPVGFSVVDSIWFGPISLLLALLDDILLITALVSAYYMYFLRDGLFGGELPTLLFASYLIMTGIEVLRTLTAFWFERRFEWKTLLLIPFLRFGYRQLLYLTAIRGLFRALTGHPMGWYKIDRTGTRLRAGNGSTG